MDICCARPDCDTTFSHTLPRCPRCVAPSPWSAPLRPESPGSGSPPAPPVPAVPKSPGGANRPPGERRRRGPNRWDRITNRYGIGLPMVAVSAPLTLLAWLLSVDGYVGLGVPLLLLTVTASCVMVVFMEWCL